MTIQLLISSTALALGMIITPVTVSHLAGHYDPNTDQALMEACRYYADHHPEASIPKERQIFLTAEGFDWQHYNYYQDCLDQKKP